jgi:DNA-binding NarL/FixJ family response regulator
MQRLTVRIFASHPVATEQYSRVLGCHEDLSLTSEPAPFDVGVFDDNIRCLDALLNLARVQSPSGRAVLLSEQSDANACLRWVLRGIWGIVGYDRYELELPAAVRQVGAGQLWCPPATVRRLMQIEVARDTLLMKMPVTDRERDVLDLLTRRLSNKEIASILRISERTAKFHVHNILSKLHVHSRGELLTTWSPVAAGQKRIRS